YLQGDYDRQVDVAVGLTDRPVNEPRLFDLLSIALMLERLRSVAVFWDEETALAETSMLLSERELARWRAAEPVNDLGAMPADIVGQGGRYGSGCGLKLFAQWRRYSDRFLQPGL